MKWLSDLVARFRRKVKGQPEPETRGGLPLLRWWLAIVLLVGCEAMTAPEGPAPIYVFSHTRYDGTEILIPASPFTPPAMYERLYRKVEACAGMRGAFDRLRFFTMPELVEMAPGLWLYGFQADDAMVVAERWAADTNLVMHEMQHHNMRINGLVPSFASVQGLPPDSIRALVHPDRYFRDCGF